MTMDYYESDSPPAGVAEGESLTVEQAIANLHSQDYSLRYYAAWWVGRFRVKEPAAIAALIAALEEESEQTKIPFPACVCHKLSTVRAEGKASTSKPCRP